MWTSDCLSDCATARLLRGRTQQLFLSLSSKCKLMPICTYLTLYQMLFYAPYDYLLAKKQQPILFRNIDEWMTCFYSETVFVQSSSSLDSRIHRPFIGQFDFYLHVEANGKLNKNSLILSFIWICIMAKQRFMVHIVWHVLVYSAHRMCIISVSFFIFRWARNGVFY